ncbi:MAG TPA: hypothetical protein ENJ53_02265 [Phaeodactylibacter sp.]|nr:hypothetical protein [Phaeodactylibacter sp.]
MNKLHLVRRALLCLFLFLFLNATPLAAQRSIQGTPISFLKKHASVFSKKTKEVKVPALNMTRIKKEDAANSSNRFAAPVPVNYTLQNSGEWTDLEDGGRVWKLKLKAKDALGIFILYKNFYLPNGARLFVYNQNKTQILGAYTNQNNAKTGQFLTGMIDGEIAIIEYYEPSYAKNQGRFEIYEIMQAYDREKIESDAPSQNYSGFGQSLPCHENINCSWGDSLQTQKRGIVRMMTVYNTGIGWCTGSLINNAENDGIPYVLSAHHCGFLGANIANFSLWRFDFNYEFSGCANEANEPTFVSLLGAEVVATAEPSDFLLLKILVNVPSTYNAYFNGWDREDVVPSAGYIIQHPFGDV